MDHVVILGSSRNREAWNELEKLLARGLPRHGGGAMRIARLYVDTGGHDTAAVCRHLRRLQNLRIAPTKGISRGPRRWMRWSTARSSDAC